MTEETYRVLIDGVTVATGMSLENATIFLKALFREYYNEDTMAVSITKEIKEIEIDND